MCARGARALVRLCQCAMVAGAYVERAEGGGCFAGTLAAGDDTGAHTGVCRSRSRAVGRGSSSSGSGARASGCVIASAD